MNNVVIDVKDVCKTFSDGENKVEVLKGVNFKVYSGQSVAILGRSGSGKSTLIQLLAGLDTYDKGDVKVLDECIQSLSISKQSDFRNKNMGFVYQFHHLLPEFSAMENVALPLIIGGMKEKEANARAMDLLTQIGLKERASHTPSKLSGGEKQRVAIARALITKPKCVLADEPTGNLDKETADLIMSIFLSLSKDLGTSIVIVTHDKELAMKCDRSVTMNNGYLIEDSK